MLSHTHPWRVPRSLFAALAPLVLVSAVTGCPGQTTVNQVTEHLTIADVIAGGTFSGYTGVSFGQSIPAGKQVHLLGATLASSSGDFSWASSLSGTTAENGGGTVLISEPSFAGTTNPINLTVDDTANLAPLFSGDDFRVYWTLAFAPSLTQSYPDGVTLTFTYSVEIE